MHPILLCFSQIYLDKPTWIIKCANTNPVGMFPITVTLGFIPLLKL